MTRAAGEAGGGRIIIFRMSARVPYSRWLWPTLVMAAVLLVVDLSAGLFFHNNVNRIDAHPALFIAWFGAAFAQWSLFVVWAVVGRSAWWLRLLLAPGILGLVFLAVVDLDFEGSEWRLLSVQAITILAGLLAARARGLRLVWLSQLERAAAAPRPQISLAYLLTIVTLVGVVLGAARLFEQAVKWAGKGEPVSGRTLLLVDAGLYGAGFGVVALMAFWAALTGWRWRWSLARAGVALSVAGSLAPPILSMERRLHGIMMPMHTLGLLLAQPVVALSALYVYRALGWRFRAPRETADTEGA